MRFSPLVLRCFLALAASGAAAETLRFDSDQSVMIVRSLDQFGTVVTEFIGEAGKMYQCIALDTRGKPLAVAPASADIGQIYFEGLRAADIADVACRKLQF